MDLSLSSADLVTAFEHVLRLCKVREGETVLIFTDPRFPHPQYPPAAFAAARSLGAEVYIMVSQGDQSLDDRLVRAAWNHADMILGMSMLPRGIGSWMYTDTHNAALAAGARVLMVQEPFEVLKRMMPTEAIRRRGLAGAQRLQEARKFTSSPRPAPITSCARTGARRAISAASPTTQAVGTTGPPGWWPARRWRTAPKGCT
ncbi:MAG: hypothetical protein M5R40_19675 [Anaerolineae bacterium]|nr:hypothetical protein [Anaerolineae bacterium]